MKIPKIALGTGGLMKGNNHLIDMIKSFKESGGAHIDTAQAYTNEEQIGIDLKSLNWSDLFITTKVHPYSMKYYTRESVEQSIKLMGHVDLVLLHGPVSSKINTKSFKELIKVRDEGMVKAVGVSNFEIDQIKDLHESTGEYPSNNQIFITPTHCNQELIDFCQSKGIVVSSFSPLNSYYRKSSELYMNEEQRKYIDSLGAKYNKTPANIIFRWLLDKNINIVFQSRNPERIKSNVDVDDFKLTKEEIQKINSFDKGIRFIEMPVPTEQQSLEGSFIYR